MEEKKLFKDWFDEEAIDLLIDQVNSAYPKFDSDHFKKIASKDLQSMEMMDRVKQFSNALKATLPSAIPTALEILVKSLPAPMKDCENVTDGWLQWPVGQFIADHCIEYREESMIAMIELTQRFSSEFAVRPFIEKYNDSIVDELLELTTHPNPHVRRWCSEGIRPRLPWGKKLHSLIQDPSPIFPILEKLLDDPELYVRRSVANNLNDIAKDHPQEVIHFCKEWNDPKPNRQWIIRHALRTLIKSGNPDALELLGYFPPDTIESKLTVDKKRLNIGESISLTLDIGNYSQNAQDLIIDYSICYVRQNNKTSSKVFKWKTLHLEPEKEVRLSKRHPMKLTTVRKLYPGKHKIEIQVNGKTLAENSFVLI